MLLFEGASADEVWSAAANRVLHGTDVRRVESRCGPTREALHAALVITNPRRRWVVSRQPAPNPAFAIAESLWILAGRNDSAFPNHWNPLLPRFQGTGDTYHGAYGHRLRRAFGIDQLARARDALTQNPTSRQVVLGIYHPALDLPDALGAPVSEDIPCNVCSILKVRDGALEWLQVMRSNDLVRGLPYNLVQFTMLQEIMAGWIGVGVGTYTHISDSLHVYESDLDAYEAGGDTRHLDCPDHLDLPADESVDVVARVTGCADALRSSTLTQEGLRGILTEKDLPPSYRNLLLVIAADAARRRGWGGMATEAARGCTNPLLAHAWELWLKHVSTRASVR